jgi:hypothetical protein
MDLLFLGLIIGADFVYHEFILIKLNFQYLINCIVLIDQGEGVGLLLELIF